MKKVLKFPNLEVEAEVPSPAPASKTRDCVIFTNWFLCCVMGGGGIRVSITGKDAGDSLLPAPLPSGEVGDSIPAYRCGFRWAPSPPAAVGQPRAGANEPGGSGSSGSQPRAALPSGSTKLGHLAPSRPPSGPNPPGPEPSQ